ncbi:MAG: 50S ribosomal protein L1 [Patescibacteria group bacterium]|jgi:large subunit ribosomal protein L1
MGNQKTVVIGEEAPEVGEPIAEHHGKKRKQEKVKQEHVKKEKPLKDDETVKEVSGEEKSEKSKEPKAEKLPKEKVGKAKIRSKRYQEVLTLVDRTKKYDLSDAIELVKKTTLTKFDGNVEVHIRLLTKVGRPENLRGFIKYPHATGQKIAVVVLDEKKVLEIEKTGKAEADIYLALPEMMPKIAKLAKILGPKGKMPNPKSGTITSDPFKTKAEFEDGQVEYKTDSYGSIHQVIGKVSAKAEILSANFKALLDVLPKEKINSLTICATMGPGIKVRI